MAGAERRGRGCSEGAGYKDEEEGEDEEELSGWLVQKKEHGWRAVVLGSCGRGLADSSRQRLLSDVCRFQLSACCLCCLACLLAQTARPTWDVFNTE